MKFTAILSTVYIDDPRIHAVNGIAFEPTPILMISDTIENREQVAARVAELLTKHWMED